MCVCVCAFWLVCASKQTYYKFCWYLPLAGLKLQWGAETERSADTHLRIQTVRAKMFQLRQELRHSNTVCVYVCMCVCVQCNKNPNLLLKCYGNLTE